MRLNLKVLVVPAVLVLGAGCSGINASHSVSPATFLLPGLMKADPPAVVDPLQGVPATPAEKVAEAPIHG